MKIVRRNFMLLFFLSIIFCVANFCFSEKNFKNIDISSAAFASETIDLKIKIGSSEFNFKDNIFDGASALKKELLLKNGIKKTVEILKNYGFSNFEIANYIFDDFDSIFQKINNKFFKFEQPDEIVVHKNKCQLEVVSGKPGVFVDKQNFYQQFVDALLKTETEILIIPMLERFKTEEINKSDFLKKSEFSTNFTTSSVERKNNIRQALLAFDGVILNEGETISFNKTTGARNKEAGYLPAKIISEGTFVEGFGGGVCQVSTTLYNACILAGLEAVEVHSHSLPVSYVEPSFDAMVSFGSSDLILKNNTSGKVVITTSSEGDKCKIAVFGKPNNYKIERVSKKTDIIKANYENVIETDYQKYGISDLGAGEEKQISYPKDGFVSEGYLNFYDNDGRLVKTKKIRESKYGATRGIVVRKEN